MAEQVWIYLEPGLYANRPGDLAPENRRRLVPAVAAREETRIFARRQSRSVLLEVGLEKSSGIARQRELEGHAVLDLVSRDDEVANALAPGARPLEVLIYPQAHQVAQSNRCHQEKFDRQGGLNQEYVVAAAAVEYAPSGGAACSDLRVVR